jgi:hypothetical protein
MPANMQQAIAAEAAAAAADAAAAAAAAGLAGSGEEMDYSEEDGEQEMHAMHDHDDLLDHDGHAQVAADAAAAAGLAADLHMQVNAAAEAGAATAQADAEAAGAAMVAEMRADGLPGTAANAEPAPNGDDNNGEQGHARGQQASDQAQEPRRQENLAAAAAQQSAAAAMAQEFQTMAQSEMEEERLLSAIERHARDFRDQVADGDDLHDLQMPPIPLNIDDMPPGMDGITPGVYDMSVFAVSDDSTGFRCFR